MTRREFTRYLVLGAGAMAAGNVGIAVWTQLRSINTGEPRPIVASTTCPSVDLPVRLPAGADPAILLRDRRSRAGGVQPEVHAPGLCRVLPSRRGAMALPVPRGQLRRPHRRGHLGTADPTLGRIEVEVRDDGMVWALGPDGVRVRRAQPAQLVRRARLRDHPGRLPGVPDHGRRGGVPRPTRNGSAWATAAVSVVMAGAAAAFLRYLRP